MSTSTADGPPAWTVEALDGDMEALAALWLEAASHGWSLAVGRYTQTWSVDSADGMAGAGYCPPDEVGDGRVDAHDAERTLMRTGVRSHAEAVAIIREFHDWPPADGQPSIALPPSETTALLPGGQP
jgi:hypothetical protein